MMWNNQEKDMVVVMSAAFLEPELETAHGKEIVVLDHTDLKTLIFCLQF